MKDCGRCKHKEDKLYVFSDGDVHLFFWCNKYGKPCTDAIKDCKNEKKKEKVIIKWE